MVKDDGKYGLINLALDAPKVIEYKCQQLLKLTSKINNQKMAKPSFLMVLMGAASTLVCAEMEFLWYLLVP